MPTPPPRLCSLGRAQPYERTKPERAAAAADTRLCTHTRTTAPANSPQCLHGQRSQRGATTSVSPNDPTRFWGSADPRSVTELHPPRSHQYLKLREASRVQHRSKEAGLGQCSMTCSSLQQWGIKSSRKKKSHRFNKC